MDPLHLTITASTVNLQWYVGQTSTTGPYTATGRYNAYKFKDDGWEQSPKRTLAFARYRISGGWESNLSLTFRNRDFAQLIRRPGLVTYGACDAGPKGDANLATFVNQATAMGYDNGRFRGSTADRKSGACANLVHHVRSTGPTWSDGPGLFD